MALFYALMAMYFYGLLSGIDDNHEDDSISESIQWVVIILIAATCWPLIILAKLYKSIRKKK